jgi:hypothetical protein
LRQGEGVMGVNHDIEISEQTLARVAPEMEPVLRQLRDVTSALSALFTNLAAAPEGYAEARAELERLIAERAPLVQRLGELAAHGLVLREAPDEDVRDVTVVETSTTPALAPTPTPPASEPALTPVITAPPAVSQRQLEEFVLSKATNGTTRTPTAAEDKTVLLSLANHVVIATETPTDLDEEISALERATDEARVPVWKRMSGPAQVRWVELLVAWAKALEEEARTIGLGEERVRAAFRRLRTFSLYDSPGFMHGFARDAEPSGASWRADAADGLVALRGRPRDNDTPKPAPASTVVVYDELDVDDERDSKVPEDWPFFDHVRGKDVVMLGGEAREERRVALEDAFQMASLTWVPHNRPKQIESLIERASQGTVDIVLVNKFVSHKDTTLLQQKSIVPIISMRLGYGVTAAKTAIEEYFSRRAASVG